MNPIQVMLIEDSPEYREVIAFGLSDESDIKIESQFSNADAALRSLMERPAEQRPDLILLDLNMPGISGLQAIPQIKACSPKTEIIILTESEQEADIVTAISDGAVGYLLKESSLAKITDGIRIVIAGGASLDPVMARYLLTNQHQFNIQPEGKNKLSPRELEILNLLADGHLQKQIAGDLKISPKTVDFHIGHIYKKLNVPNAPSAVAKAYKTGIFRFKGHN